MQSTDSGRETEAGRHDLAGIEHERADGRSARDFGVEFMDGSESESVDSEPVESKPLDSESMEPNPVDSEPIEPNPVDSEPVPHSTRIFPNLPEFSEKKYRIYGFLILLFALFFRLFHLGERVLHHDESVHASFTLKLLENGQYSYNPAYHGPFLYHVTALVFHFFGINDFTARLLPVLFGVAAVLALFLLKKELGKRGVLWSAFLLAFSPSMVYFSRFFRNDMIIVFCTIAAVAGGVRYIENLHSLKRYPYLILSVSALAIAVTAKENAYLILLIFGAYVGLSICYKIYFSWRLNKRSRQRAGKQIEQDAWKEVGQEQEVEQEIEPKAEQEVGQEAKKEAYELLNSQKKPRKSSFSFKSFLPFIPDIILSVALFLFIVMLFYTSLFRNPESLSSIVERAFSHWMAMHRIQRIGGPFYYYLPLLLVYEIPILLFGILGFLHFLEKKGENAWFYYFLCYWAFTSLLLYSYLQEKVPWLVVHIVLPLGILAGAYLGEIFSWKESLSYKKGRLIAGLLVLTLLISLVQCISVNYYKSMDPAERITYTQASPDIRELMEKIDGFRLGPDRLKIYVFDPNNLYWPLPWYLRDYEKTSYVSKLPQNKVYDAVIVPSKYDMYDQLSEDKYASYNFTLRPGKEFTLYYKVSLEK